MGKDAFKGGQVSKLSRGYVFLREYLWGGGGGINCRGGSAGKIGLKGVQVEELLFRIPLLTYRARKIDGV